MMTRPLLLGCIGLAVSACMLTEPSERDELRNNRARWEARRLTSYEFVFQRMCDCLPADITPKRATVQEGRISSVVDLQTGEQITSERPLALSRGVNRMTVRYHPALG